MVTLVERERWSNRVAIGAMANLLSLFIDHLLFVLCDVGQHLYIITQYNVILMYTLNIQTKRSSMSTLLPPNILHPQKTLLGPTILVYPVSERFNR